MGGLLVYCNDTPAAHAICVVSVVLAANPRYLRGACGARIICSCCDQLRRTHEVAMTFR